MIGTKRDRLAAVFPKSDRMFRSGCACRRALPLPARAEQTQRAETGGEERERGRHRGGGNRRTVADAVAEDEAVQTWINARCNLERRIKRCKNARSPARRTGV